MLNTPAILSSFARLFRNPLGSGHMIRASRLAPIYGLLILSLIAGSVAAELGHIEQQMSLENTRQGLLFQGSNQYLDLMRNVRLIAVA